jgi:hypothetical protein
MGGVQNPLTNVEPIDKGTRPHRTRRSDYIASLSLVSLVGLSGFVWKLRGDVEQLVANSANSTTGRVELRLGEIREELRQTSDEAARIASESEARCEKATAEMKIDIRDLRSQLLQMIQRGRR